MGSTMLNATEIYPLTTALAILLWIEFILYTGAGVFKIFDDFFRKNTPWVFVDGRLNLYAYSTDLKNHKSNASFAFLLGFVALNGIIEGGVNRFELELMFVGLALITCILFCFTPPAKRILRVIWIAPDIYVQIALYLLCAPLIRPEVIGLCALLIAWGIFVYFRKLRTMEGAPFEWEQYRDDTRAMGGSEAMLKAYDKFAGYKEPKEPAGVTSAR